MDDTTRARIMALAADPLAIDRRLDELEAEWDIERIHAASDVLLATAQAGLSLARRRRLLPPALPLVVAAFVLQHALRGARPTRGLLRRLGYRDREEIALERSALTALRGGSFDRVAAQPSLLAAALRTASRLVFSRRRRQAPAPRGTLIAAPAAADARRVD